MECVTGDGEEEVREFFINDNGYLVQVTDRKYRVDIGGLLLFTFD